MEAFINTLQQLIELNDEQEAKLSQAFVRKSYKKGDFLAEEGKVCDRICFLQEGYMRVYVLKDIDENTVHISGPGSFCSAFSSFISRQPSFEYVQVISDCEVLEVSFDDLIGLYNDDPKFDRLGRLILETLFVGKEDRVISFIKYNAEERYNHLLEKYPDMLMYVPLQYLASYLGVKPETLSRIRAKR